MRSLTAIALLALVCGCHAGKSVDDLGSVGDLGGFDAGLVLDFSDLFDFASADLATGPISVAPDPLDFGSVINKTTATLSITITNPAGAPIAIQGASTTGAGFAVDASTLPVSLAAGESITLMVSFSPMVVGSATGMLSIAHDGGSSPALVPLVGQSIHAVTLSWTASVSSGVAGYNLYRGTTSGGPYPMKVNAMKISGVTYEDIQVLGCKTYYYVATAIGSTGVESGYSNEAIAALPCP